MPQLTLDAVEDLARRVLRGAGASDLQAGATARSIREAEADGIRNVGLGYLPTYADHVLCGKVVGHAVPEMFRPRPAVVAVNARNGFAHPAFEAGRAALVASTRECGIGVLSVSHSYSAGVVGWFVEQLAGDGLVSLMFANSSSLMAPWGGRNPFFGTNPMAWAVPRTGHAPLVADMSSSAVAWVNVNEAAANGRPIPLGWALDASGNPTTDAHEALAGTMAPSGGHKGSALALLIDLFAGGLTGSNFSHEASSFGGTIGGPPNVGQLIIAIDPGATIGSGFADRVETELTAMTSEDGVRLPGAKRVEHRVASERDGVDVPADLLATLEAYAQDGSSVQQIPQ